MFKSRCSFMLLTLLSLVDSRYMAITHTTNAIESLHSQVRKAIRNKGHFPSDQAASKLIYQALRNITEKSKNRPRNGMLRRRTSRSSSETDLC